MSYSQKLASNTECTWIWAAAEIVLKQEGRWTENMNHRHVWIPQFATLGEPPAACTWCFWSGCHTLNNTSWYSGNSLLATHVNAGHKINCHERLSSKTAGVEQCQ